MKRIEFTPEQSAEMRAMRRNGKSWDEIAILFGVSHWTIRQHIIGKYPERNRRTMPRGMRMVDLNLGPINRPFVPEDRLADRDRRATLEPRDLTASFFGDPLPGYSALDRR